MGQQQHVVEFQQLGVHRRLVFEHVQPGAGDLALAQLAHQGVLVDHLAARGVDDIGMRRQQIEPARRQQVEGGRRMRAVHRDDVHAGQHLVEAFPVGRLQLLLDAFVYPLAVVVVDREAKGAGAPGDSLADTAHADDAEPLAPDALAQHPGGRPALELAFAQGLRAFHQAARHGEDQGHGHVGGVFGQHAGGVGDGDAAPSGGGQVDMVDAGAEIGDQAEIRAGMGQDGAIDAVGDGRHLVSFQS